MDVLRSSCPRDHLRAVDWTGLELRLYLCKACQAMTCRKRHSMLIVVVKYITDSSGCYQNGRVVNDGISLVCLGRRRPSVCTLLQNILVCVESHVLCL